MTTCRLHRMAASEYNSHSDGHRSDSSWKRSLGVIIKRRRFALLSIVRCEKYSTQFSTPKFSGMTLKGVCHKIFWVLFWHVWIDLGLYKNL
jgi:hypothetical protein